MVDGGPADAVPYVRTQHSRPCPSRATAALQHLLTGYRMAGEGVILRFMQFALYFRGISTSIYVA